MKRTILAALLSFPCAFAEREISAAATVSLAETPIEERPLVTRSDSLARADRELSRWRAAIGTERPRLFFDKTEWTTLRTRAAAPEALRFFDAALETAAKTGPAPAYRSPKEVANGKPLRAKFTEELWQRPAGDDMVALALAAVLRPDEPRFRDTLRESVLTACAYPGWGSENADLSAAHIARGIAVARDWLPDLWSADELALIRKTIRSRMGDMLAGLYGKANWARRHGNNHNQVAAAGLGLCGLAFLDEVPGAAEWLAAAQTNFERVMLYNNSDGSSAEGVPYWSYGMSFILQYIEGVRRVVPGAASLYESDYLKNATAFRLTSATSGFGGLMQWGDAVNRDFYGPQHLLHRLASVYRDEGAQFLAQNIPLAPFGGNDVPVWRALWFDPAVKASPPHELDRHLAAGDIAASRSGWSSDDYLLAIKSGFTRRNHSHLDIGALAFAFGDEWLVTTPGYGKGNGQRGYWQGAGPRWTFQANATESHTTLLVNGANQRSTFDSRGVIRKFSSEGDWCFTDIDLTGAYDDAKSVRRRVLHRRGDYILVVDDVRGVRAPDARGGEGPLIEWLLQTSPAGAPGAGNARVIEIKGQCGGLDVNLLAPGGAAGFAPYTPRSKHPDVQPGRLKSWTAGVPDADAEFVVLLEPRFGNAPSRIHASMTKRGNGARVVTVKGGPRTGDGEWIDTITVPSSSGAATYERRGR
ncbi:MAG: heparinase II/III-family protein [Opitutaceae bacterium]|jgi:hypothetical protein|nr:heparinase II/III-family protein [Opitutaceae bacterium]